MAVYACRDCDFWVRGNQRECPNCGSYRPDLEKWRLQCVSCYLLPALFVGPSARLEELSLPAEGGVTVVLPVQTDKPDVYPIRLASEDAADPLLGILGQVARSELPLGLRLAWGSAPSDWEAWARSSLEAIRSGRQPPPRGWRFRLYQLLQLVQPSNPSAKTASSLKAETLTGLEMKVREPVFTAQVSVFAVGSDVAGVEQRCRDLAKLLATGFRHSFGNSLNSDRRSRGSRRATERVPNIALTAAELGSLFHLAVFVRVHDRF